MTKNNKKVLSIIILTVFILATFTLFLTIHFITNSLDRISTLDYYKMGNDNVIAITNIVGKRKTNSFNTKTNNNVSIKEYGYTNVKNVKSDINYYINELLNKGYINTTNINLSNNSGKIKLANYSVDDNKIIILTINYNKNGYKIIIEKGKGSIQPYN